MEHLSIATRTELLAYYFECGRSPTRCLRRYNKEHGTKVFICSESTIRNLVERFFETGSVADLPKTGRPSVSTEQIEKVTSAVKEIQQTAHLGTASTSQVLPSTGIPRSTV
jgi:tRNA G26 N,N-dimethylase Trm1